MFGNLLRRIAKLVETRRKAVRGEIAATLKEAAPRGVSVEEIEEGVVLAGRNLIRRAIVDPAVRWIAARLK